MPPTGVFTASHKISVCGLWPKKKTGMKAPGEEGAILDLV